MLTVEYTDHFFYTVCNICVTGLHQESYLCLIYEPHWKKLGNFINDKIHLLELLQYLK